MPEQVQGGPSVGGGDPELESLRAEVQPVRDAVQAAMTACFKAESATVTGWASLRDDAVRAAMRVVAQALQEPHEILLLFNEISRDITSDWAQKYETLRSTRLQTYIDRVGLREAADSYEGRQRWLATAEALVERLKVNP